MQITEYYFYHPAAQGCTKWNIWLCKNRLCTPLSLNKIYLRPQIMMKLKQRNVTLKWCHVIFTTAFFFLNKWWVLSSIYLLKVYISNRPKILSYLMCVKVSWSRSVKQESGCFLCQRSGKYCVQVCFKTRSKTNFSQTQSLVCGLVTN